VKKRKVGEEVRGWGGGKERRYRDKGMGGGENGCRREWFGREMGWGGK